MTCIAKNCAILHYRKIFLVNDLIASGHGYEEVAYLRRFMHRHYIKAIHYRFDCLYRIDLRNDYSCTKSLCSHCSSLTAPAIACHYYSLSCHDQVSSTVNAVPYRLSCTIAVIKQMLAVCIIDTNHREFQFSCLVHCFQTDNSCCCLFTAAYDRRNQLRHLRMDHIYKIAAVVNDDVRSGFQNMLNLCFIFFRRTVIPCVDLKSCLYQRCCHIILCGQGVGACNIHFSSACLQYQTKICCFCLKVNGKSNFLSCKGFGL